MYEKQTETTIFSRMMESVSNSIDKREGSIIYDTCKPTAIEVMMLYAMCDYFLTNTFGDTAERPYLIERAKERGLAPYHASYSTVKLSFTPTDIDIPIGSRFSYDDVNYAVTQKGDGFYYAVCETAGTAGNKPAGALITIDYIKGLQSVSLVQVTIPGENEEDTETFRARYLASFNSQAYGGNFADYREKVDAIDGVGGIKIYRPQKAGGNLRLVFMTSEYKIPTAEFIDKVQTLIDPIPNQGSGLGIAPFGHIVTVEAVTNSSISIDLEIQFSGAYTFEDFRTDIEKVIDNYFLTLNKTWESTQKIETNNIYNDGLLISRAKIESNILDINGISDVLHTKINGKEENLTLDPNSLAIRGTLNGS